MGDKIKGSSVLAEIGNQHTNNERQGTGCVFAAGAVLLPLAMMLQNAAVEHIAAVHDAYIKSPTFTYVAHAGMANLNKLGADAFLIGAIVLFAAGAISTTVSLARSAYEVAERKWGEWSQDHRFWTEEIRDGIPVLERETGERLRIVEDTGLLTHLERLEGNPRVGAVKGGS